MEYEAFIGPKYPRNFACLSHYFIIDLKQLYISNKMEHFRPSVIRVGVVLKKSWLGLQITSSSHFKLEHIAMWSLVTMYFPFLTMVPCSYLVR